MSDPATYREAADFLEKFGAETYPTDLFIRPTTEQYAQINALLKRERGHQLDGVAADCMRHAYRVAAHLLRERADDLEEDA